MNVFKSIILVLVLTTWLITPGPLSGETQGKPKLEKITANLYNININDNDSVTFYITSKGVLVIDSEKSLEPGKQIHAIIPGHGKMVDQRGFTDAIQKSSEYLDNMLVEMQLLVEKGISIEEAKPRVKMSQHQDPPFAREALKWNMESVYRKLTREKSGIFDLQTREINHFDYMGQKLPGTTPVIFAPGIVSTKNRDHSDLLFYPNGKEIYWSVAFHQKSAAIMVIKWEDGKWASPEVASFSSPQYFDCIPSLSPEGKKLFFSSMRPVKKNEQPSKLNIWQVERKGDNWSDPMPLGEVVNHSGHDSNPLIARNGNLYFDSDRPGGEGSWDIYYSKYINGRFIQPKNLGVGVNTEHIEICSYIDPDERFLIFTSYDRPEGLGSGDIYIGFRNERGEWSRVKNLGEPINTKFEEAFGTFSPDRKYFFFGSNRSRNMDVYWVDAEVIKKLKLKEL